MGCGNSNGNGLPRPGQDKLVIWGDYFNSDTRTMLAILDIAGVPKTMEEVDQFKGDQKKEAYLAQNPTG